MPSMDVAEPFTEGAVFARLMALFSKKARGERIDCLNYLSGRKTTEDRYVREACVKTVWKVQAVIYLLKTGGLPLEAYTFVLDSGAPAPRSKEVDEVIAHLDLLTDSARARTNMLAQELVFEPEVERLVRGIRGVVDKKKADDWWFPLLALVLASSKEELTRKPNLKENKVDLFMLVQEHLYRRIEEEVYRSHQDELVMHYPEAWEKAQILLGMGQY